MEIEYLGGNCIKLTNKKVTFVINDDDLLSLGLTPLAKKPEVALYSKQQKTPPEAEFMFDSPGEYEVYDVSIQGIAAKGFSSQTGAKDETIYRLVVDDIRIAVVGNVSPDLDDSQLEAIGTIDILFTPVGGAGVTLDGVGALKLIKKIEPKLVVPTYYADKALKYDPMPSDLGVAVKEMSMEPVETVDKLKVKGRVFPDSTQLVILARQ